MRTEVASMLVMKKINFFMLISFLFFQCYSANAMHHKILKESAFIGGAAAIFLGANCCKHSDVAEPKEEDKQGQDEEQHFKKDEPIKIDRYFFNNLKNKQMTNNVIIKKDLRLN